MKILLIETDNLQEMVNKITVRYEEGFELVGPVQVGIRNGFSANTIYLATLIKEVDLAPKEE